MQNTNVILLRHGQCEGGNILRGQVDVGLSKQGELQMKVALAAVFESKNASTSAPDVIISSSLIRCSGPAKAFATSHQLPLFVDDGFKELNFGDWDGKTFDALYQSDAAALDSYWANPWLAAPPNGESMQDFETRIELAWQDMIEQHQGKQILLVTHGGVIRYLMSKVLGVSRCAGFYTSLKLPYAAKVQIDILHDGDTPHLSLNWA
ncbi:histidine phosphatase family protein [Shewanella marinintestina]|uniref:histidine phosphatase family protein n=1 Tax=Shewanella marinintestina TaxID=190305 RepID=UPI00200CFB3D|nr:histidine phosphatase family protein [Shewanella marinintestina]MCL1146334.1 histidine phosphatase family protein [Shewanella marinintestina]